jgi:ribosomal protein L5
LSALVRIQYYPLFKTQMSWQQMHKKTIGRYELVLPLLEQPAYSLAYPKAYLTHIQFWNKMEKGVIHSTSKALLVEDEMSELYGSLSLALSIMSVQTPKFVKSKKSVAAFKVMKGMLTGSTSHLRKKRLLGFCYKWVFLGASLELTGSFPVGQAKSHGSLGLTNLFVFELDELDYICFEPLSGLDIGFELKNPLSFRE